MTKTETSRLTFPATLTLPDGAEHAGEAAVRGANALIFIAGKAISTPWPAGRFGQLRASKSGQIGGKALDLTVVANGITGEGFDLTIINGMTESAIRATGMQLRGAPYTKEQALAELQETNEGALGALEDSLRAFIISLGDLLFDLSTSAKQGASVRHQHYDTLNALKRKNREFLAHLMGELQREMSALEKSASDRSSEGLGNADASDLGLVDLEEMDEKLAMERAASDAASLYRVELECLTLRVGDLLGLGAAAVKTLYHPIYLCRAFTSSMHMLEATPEVIQDSLHFFHREWLRKLRGFYVQLNLELVDAGLRPNAEEEIQVHGSIIERASSRRAAKAQASTDVATQAPIAPVPDRAVEDAAEAPPLTPQAPPTPPPASRAPERDVVAPSTPAPPPPPPVGGEAPAQPVMKHDAIYNAVINALNSRSVDEDRTGATAASTSAPTIAAQAPADQAGSAQTSTAQERAVEPPIPDANAQSVLAALKQLQQMPALQGGDFAERPLRQILHDHAGELDALGGASEVERESGNRLDFVDNVFQTMRSSLDISDNVKPTLNQLRLPLARLALNEPRFFADPQHAAHQMLDKLSRLATAENFPNKVLERKVNAIVDDVASDYDGDNVVFETALTKLEQLVGQQETALNKNIERVVSGLQGQEKLQHAQREVNRLLSVFIRPPSAPRVLLDLMDSGWRDLLVQTAVREGDDSDNWQQQVGTLEEIIKVLGTLELGEPAVQAARDLMPKLEALRGKIAVAQPGNMDHEDTIRELKSILVGEIPLETYPVDEMPEEVDEEERQSRIAQLPRLHRWVKRVEQMELGTQLSYRDKQGFRRRMRLIWVSEDGQRYAFVNELGQKVAELDKVQLARKLSHGLKPQGAVDKMSVLNQSIYGTLSGAQEKLSFKRSRDRVTQLVNADALRKQLARSVQHAQQHDVKHAFLCLDIDSFHLVNELYDEVDGDQVLAEFARLLSMLNERRSLTARLEDDVFGLLLAYRTREEAIEFAEKVRTDIAESSVAVAGEEVSFTVSIGIAPIFQASESADAVMQQAYEATALAKKRGGNRSVAYDVDEQQLIEFQQEREQSRQQLDDAISTDSLVLRAQPIVQSAIDGSVPVSHHYEILLSLRQEDGSLLSPQDFIVSAERFGFINMVDRWVLRKVCEWISSLMDQQKVVPQLAINLSGTSLTDDTFMDYVLEQISEFGVGTSKLCFEITETGAIENLTKAADFVRTLRNIGCKFSLDDFGTGLASYNYLRELPVDYVKIDGTFITNILTNETDYAMARSINDLAHFLGQQTIAECVETLDIVEPLRELGIDYLQGWGVGMPQELHEITRELASLET